MSQDCGKVVESLVDNEIKTANAKTQSRHTRVDAKRVSI